jgi:hypothetical protein
MRRIAPSGDHLHRSYVVRFHKTAWSYLHAPARDQGTRAALATGIIFVGDPLLVEDGMNAQRIFGLIPDIFSLKRESERQKR